MTANLIQVISDIRPFAVAICSTERFLQIILRQL